jgi:hypothetical protein
VRAAVGYNLRNSSGYGGSDHCLFHADSREGGKLSIELIRSGRYRYTWVGGILRRHWMQWDTPERLPILEPYVAELWPEVRSGFAHSEVYQDDPRDHGLYATTGPKSELVRVDLPFDWAEDILVFFLMSQEDHEPHELIVSTPAEDYYIPIDQVDWGFPLPGPVFDPYAPPFDPPNPECWRVQGAH